jgi:hypothetical protein
MYGPSNLVSKDHPAKESLKKGGLFLNNINNQNQSIGNSAAAERSTQGRGASERKRQGSGPEALGLSKSHIRPRVKQNLDKSISSRPNKYRNKIIYYPKAQFIQVKQPRGGNKKVVSKRGIIQTFSIRSRKRMMNLAARIEKENTPIFVTLTYPEVFPSAIGAKRDFKVFIQRIKRLWSNLGYMWKLEFQKRGAPHFHLFLWNVDFIEALKKISNIWYEVCGTNDQNHLLAGTRVEKIIISNGIMSYASKYLGKIISEESPEGLGRIWGYGGNIPISSGEEYIINDRETYKILRHLRRRIKHKTNDQRIRAFYIPHPERWHDHHEELTGDEIPF